MSGCFRSHIGGLSLEKPNSVNYLSMAPRYPRPCLGPPWQQCTHTHTHTYTHPFNGPLSGTTQVSRYQKGKTNLGFTEARDSEWQCHQLGHMQICTSLQTNNHASTPPLSFLQAGCPSCCPTNSVEALKERQCSTLYKFTSLFWWITPVFT